MKYIFLISLLLFSLQTSAIDVVLINPSVPGTAFWDRVSAAANGAAKNLNINLTIIYGKDNRIYNFDTLVALVAQKKHPDYVIFSPFDGTAERSFSLLDKAKISILVR